ncbi:hypothetical protein [Haloferula sp. BvORR071]|uniref:hypothetical protein n=1 Tax=Haloferula sp. BvORR071 TaxID=1396141 RepID=UPI000697C9D0|nr:hypothetical protein [Haloferula sp. BvORR071]
MLTREIILETERKMTELHRRVHDTHASRHRENTGFKDWRIACQEWHAYQPATAVLWLPEFHQRLRVGDPEAMEEAILFLELDPWFFGSGYLKERLIRILKSAPLGERECVRLRNVVWNVARGRNRREFRNFCALGARVSSPDFVARLELVSDEENLSSRGKLHRLRDHLRHHAADYSPTRSFKRSRAI